MVKRTQKHIGHKNVLVRLPDATHMKLKLMAAWHQMTIPSMVGHIIETFYRDNYERRRILK